MQELSLNFELSLLEAEVLVEEGSFAAAEHKQLLSRVSSTLFLPRLTNLMLELSLTLSLVV